ncbi:MAG: REP-associated tyrosine transposase [Acidobacteriaceae bacterium]
MTRNLKRYHESGNLHFVTFSCYDRRPYLALPEASRLFESSLESIRVRYRFLVVGYVVMPEHIHLLVSEPEDTLLSAALQALKVSVSKQSPQRPFWQARYYDFNVFTERKRIEKLRYMHRNPVKRGLVERPENWPWSSFNHYARVYRVW